MAHLEGHVIHDADAHIMEAPEFAAEANGGRNGLPRG